MISRFSADATLAGLKDFQRRTVEYAFRRLFIDKPATSRFLVADEVGLGKTLIARGLVAKAIERLQDAEERIDIIYVCSNADIARQNVDRLGVPGMKPFAMATRLTLLPLHIHDLRAHNGPGPKVNLVSFTPGTTFEQGNRSGRKDERRLIYQMLRHQLWCNWRALRNALQGTAGDSWSEYADEAITYDEEIGLSFVRSVVQDAALKEELVWVFERYNDRRTLRTVSREDRNRCLALIGRLRQILARECLNALEPDLVILDEFQRFRDLLRDPEENPEAELAHALFNYEKVRILLLSATPYKMYASDRDDEDHYADFLKTTEFLLQDIDAVGTLEFSLKEFRQTLLQNADSPEAVRRISAIRSRIEELLLSVMCRTERVGHTEARDGMVCERLIRPQLAPLDFKDFRFIDKVAGAVGQQQEVIEYWKSGSYLLNFMKTYQLKEVFKEKARRPSAELVEILESHADLLLQSRNFERYQHVDPGNPRLRALLGELEKSGIWRLLWMPASMPYWSPEGAYATVSNASKQLVFSAWNVVPDVIAALTSYLAERLVMAEAGYQGAYSSMPSHFAPRLRFSIAADGKPAGMSTLALMFPSPTLAAEVDPLTIANSLGDSPSLSAIRNAAIAKVRELLTSVIPGRSTGSLPDRRWYWMAVIRLERARHPEFVAWCREQWAQGRQGAQAEARPDEEGTDKSFLAHVGYWAQCWDSEELELGRVPDDLAEVVADLALSGHAVCALRSLRRAVSEPSFLNEEVLRAAVRVAEGMRSQFNHPLAIALLKSDDDDAYWQRVLRYGMEGNLQSVLDEYAHVLSERVGWSDTGSGDSALRISELMVEAMTLRTAQLKPDEIHASGGRVEIEHFSVRCHFALRMGELSDDAGPVARKEAVREAFNSPFRPFVLASTSVGQEGLDFHTWCHSIVHWNLPSNPVDMEQREGRVHRYKGYAVRKNVARQYRMGLLGVSADDDPWMHVFGQARESRPDGSSDLSPYWIFDCPGGDKIDRRVFDLPYSRDQSRYRALRKGLSLYRLVFAQPRQEDLMGYLEARVGAAELESFVENSLIRLEPPKA